jgi:hypothetical protein
VVSLRSALLVVGLAACQPALPSASRLVGVELRDAFGDPLPDGWESEHEFALGDVGGGHGGLLVQRGDTAAVLLLGGDDGRRVLDVAAVGRRRPGLVIQHLDCHLDGALDPWVFALMDEGQSCGRGQQPVVSAWRVDRGRHLRAVPAGRVTCGHARCPTELPEALPGR